MEIIELNEHHNVKLQEEYRNKNNILNNSEQLSKANTSLKNTIKEQDKIISEKMIEIEDSSFKIEECQSELGNLELKLKLEKDVCGNLAKQLENKDLELELIKNQLKESQGINTK